jgi:hypothetical protein
MILLWIKVNQKQSNTNTLRDQHMKNLAKIIYHLGFLNYTLRITKSTCWSMLYLVDSLAVTLEFPEYLKRHSIKKANTYCLMSHWFY